MERTCEVWAIGKSCQRRLFDRIRYRHARHECVLSRWFGREHVSEYHRCKCGKRWPRQETDND